MEDAVDAWLPELANRQVLRRPDGPLDETVPANRPITVRDLLTFTWGFGMQGAMFMAAEPWPIFTATLDRALHTFGPPQPAAMPDPDTWLARLGELPLLAQPGERWLYQTGSQVLGVLAARVAGRSFEDVMRDRLFDPIGMRSTGFHAADISRLTTAYDKRDGQFVGSDGADGQWSRPPAFADGGAGLVSSVDDVVAFGRMLLRHGEPVLQSAKVAQMTSNQLTPEQRANVWPSFDLLDGRGWGYGVSVLDDGRYAWEGGLGTSWYNVPSQTSRSSSSPNAPRTTRACHRCAKRFSLPLNEVLDHKYRIMIGSGAPRRRVEISRDGEGARHSFGEVARAVFLHEIAEHHVLASLKRERVLLAGVRGDVLDLADLLRLGDLLLINGAVSLRWEFLRIGCLHQDNLMLKATEVLG